MMGGVRLALILLIAAVGGQALATPYEDTQGRFRLDLGEGWTLAPRFGDTQGMVFEHRGTRRGEVAVFMVRVQEAEGSLQSWGEALERGIRGQPGFQRLRSSRTTISGQPARVQNYRALIPQTSGVQKRMRWYLMAAGDRFYLLHAEGEQRLFRRLLPEFEAMVRSFRIPKPKRPQSAASAMPSLQGAWVAESGLVLSFQADQRFRLSDLSGRYELSGDRLILHPEGRAEQRFQYSVDLVKGTLTLQAPGLPKPIRYVKRSAKISQKEPTKRSDPRSLLGRWKAGGIILVLRADRSFSMGKNFSGQWRAKDGRLELIQSKSERLSYRYRVLGGHLTLSGADLEKPVVFTRASDP